MEPDKRMGSCCCQAKIRVHVKRFPTNQIADRVSFSGEGGRGKEKEEGKEGGYIHLKKNKKTTLHRPTTTQWLPQGSSPQGPPEGRGEGGELAKNRFLHFSNTSFWHYGAKPLKIGEQSYTFLIFFSKTAFSKSPRMFWEFGCCWNLWQPLLPLFFGGAQR